MGHTEIFEKERPRLVGLATRVATFRAEPEVLARVTRR